MDYEITILICKLCNNTYNDPIKLPCFNSICSNHVEITNSPDSTFECHLCNQTHLIPENGFKKNDELNLLLQMESAQNSLKAKESLQMKELCNKMRQLLQKADHILKEPSYYIYEYFNELRNIVDLEREKLIEKINNEHSKVLDKLKEEQAKCMANKNYNASEFNTAIDSSAIELEKWLNFNENKNWFNLKCEREHEIHKLEFTIDEFQKELLLNKKYKFEENKCDEKIFGVLNILEDKSEKNNFKNTIYFEIKEFKSFITDKLDRYYDKYFVLNGIPWKILFKIENIDEDYTNYETILCAYLIADFDKDVLTIKQANLAFKLIDLDEKKINQNVYYYKGLNYKNRSIICSINHLIDSRNKFYNRELDLVKLEIDIEIETSDEMIHKLFYGSEEQQLNATHYFLKLATSELNSIFNENIMKKYVELLQNDNHRLQFEFVCILTNIASANSSKVIKSGALPILVKLLSSDSEDIQNQAIWTLRLLVHLPKQTTTNSFFNEENSIKILIEKLFKAGVYSRLVELLLKDSQNLVLAVFDLIDIILSGNELQIQVILKCKLLNSLFVLLNCSNEMIKMQNLILISKLVFNNPILIQAVFDANIFSKLIEILNDKSENNNIKKEAIFIFKNVSNGTQKQIENIIDMDIISTLCNLLLSIENDNELVELCLDSLDSILKLCCCKDELNEENNTLIKYKMKIVDCNGLEKIYSLMTTYQSTENIFKKAFELIEFYNLL